jgi:PAS domain S-box-containing protein
MFDNDASGNTRKPDTAYQDLYRRIFERSKKAVFIADGSSRIIETNPAGLDLSGYKAEEIAGMKLNGLVHPEDHCSCAILNDVRPADSRSSHPARILKKDGTFVNAELSFSGLSDDLFMISARVSKKVDSSGNFTQNHISETLRAALDALPMWIACVDTAGNYIFANKHYYSTFKNPPENIEGHNIKEFFPQALYETHKSLLDKCIEGRTTITFENEADFENGLNPYIYGVYTPLFAEDGTVYGMSAAVSDITAKKDLGLRVRRADEALKESVEKHRSLVENSLCGIAITDDGQIIYANETIMKICGYDDFSEFSSKKIFDYNTPESAKYIKDLLSKKARGEKVPEIIEIQLTHKNGDIRTLLAKISDIMIENKPCHETTFIDITEMRKNEIKLKELADRYECIVDVSGQIVYDYNVTTGYIYYGSNAEKVLGYKPEEIEEFDTWLKMLHPDDKAETLEKLSAAEAAVSLFDAEYRLRHKDGHYVWIRDRGYFLPDHNGRAARQIGMIEDITGRKKASDAIICARKQAEAAGRAKSLFLANISHEIRTPMNGIIGFTNLMAASGLNHKQKEFNDIIKNSCLQLLQLIDDLLDFSKIEADKLKLDNDLFDLKAAVDSSIKLVSEQSGIKKLQMETFIDERINYKVRGDAFRFRQILLNLLTNAVKFTYNGKVGVRISQMAVNSGISTVSIEVYDTGIGIPPEKTGKIFEMFNQFDEPDTRHNGGSGIGLSIVRKLVEMMEGSVSIESEVGKGSRFTVVLPLSIV